MLGHRLDAGGHDRGLRRAAASGAQPRRVIGIDGSAKPAETRAQVARIARFTAGLIGLGRDLRDDEIILDDRYHAGTYGIPDDATLEAMRLAARLEAMITDPVYEGKSMAGMIDLVARGEIEPPRTSSTPTSAASPRSTPTRPVLLTPARYGRFLAQL